MGILFVVGIGPGDISLINRQALYAIEQSDYICGYETYIKQIKNIIKNKKIYSNKMGKEKERVKEALDLANQGFVVSLISGGDASLYAMASLTHELNIYDNIKIEIVPGITAALAASAKLGAPISDDLAIISMSDLLTSWNIIKSRINAVNIGDFVCAIYNPKSSKRTKQIKYAIDEFYKKRGNLLCGIVKNCFRDNEEIKICTLSSFDYNFVDMSSIVIVGNTKTYKKNNILITPRGYL